MIQRDQYDHADGAEYDPYLGLRATAYLIVLVFLICLFVYVCASVVFAIQDRNRGMVIPYDRLEREIREMERRHLTEEEDGHPSR
jgi:hypothetical protein